MLRLLSLSAVLRLACKQAFPLAYGSFTLAVQKVALQALIDPSIIVLLFYVSTRITDRPQVPLTDNGSILFDTFVFCRDKLYQIPNFFN